jgi:hypothetical protein
MDIVSKGWSRRGKIQERTREFDQITSSTNELPNNYESHSIMLFKHKTLKLIQEHYWQIWKISMIRTSTLLNLRHTIFRMHSDVLNIFTELISLRGCHPPSDQCSDTDIAYQIYFYRNSQLPNDVIIIKTNLLFPESETKLYYFGYPV